MGGGRVGIGGGWRLYLWVRSDSTGSRQWSDGRIREQQLREAPCNRKIPTTGRKSVGLSGIALTPMAAAFGRAAHLLTALHTCEQGRRRLMSSPRRAWSGAHKASQQCPSWLSRRPRDLEAGNTKSSKARQPSTLSDTTHDIAHLPRGLGFSGDQGNWQCHFEVACCC